MNRRFLNVILVLLEGCALLSFGCDKKESHTFEDRPRKLARHNGSANSETPKGGRVVDFLESLKSKKEITNDDIDSLYNRIDQVSSKDFDEFWNSLNQLEVSTYFKYRLLSRSLHGLALSGDFDKALAIAKRETVSNNRSTLLCGVFGGARGEFSTILKEYESLSKVERDGAVAGITESIGSRGDLSIDKFKSLGKISTELKRGLISGLDLYVGEDINRLDEVKKICKSIEIQGEGNAGIFETVLSYRVAENIELVMPEFETMETGKGDGWKMLIAELAKRDPEGVMNILLVRNDAADMSFAASKWAGVDYSEAYKWFSAHQQTMAPKVLDKMLDTFADSQLKNNSIATARAFIDKIQDPQIKMAAEGRVWSAERNELRRDVGNDPAGAIQGIVAGQSKYADYWLEEAMGTWVAKDFDKAQEWYQQNWRSLPASKSQYVAAAFANQALKQGDTATAGQWAALIQDPKTKQRVQDGINKAVVKNQNQ